MRPIHWMVCFSVCVLAPLPWACSSKDNPTAPPAPPNTPTITDTPTVTLTPTQTGTSTNTLSPTVTFTSTYTPTATDTLTITNTPTITDTPTITMTPTATPIFSAFVTIGSAANMNYPYGLVYLGGGNLWVANTVGNSFQQWTTAGGGPSPNVTTFNGGSSFNTPTGIAKENDNGNFYVADSHNHQIEVFGSSGDYKTSFGSTQFGSDAIGGVVVNDYATTVYALDDSSHKGYIWAIDNTKLPDLSFTYVGPFADSGSGALGSAGLLKMNSFGSGLMAADYNNGKIFYYNLAGAYTGSITVGGYPFDMVDDGFTHLYVTDHDSGSVREVSITSGATVAEFGKGLLDQPTGIAIDSSFNYIYVADSNNNRIIGFQKN